jgi:hypothetical protein
MEKLHIQPSELDMLPYYEFEYIISIYNDILKERKGQETDSYNTERDKYNMKGLSDMKMPKMPSIKLPKL